MSSTSFDSENGQLIKQTPLPVEFLGQHDWQGRMICPRCDSSWWRTDVVFNKNTDVEAVRTSGVVCGRCGWGPLGMERTRPPEPGPRH